MLRVGVRCIDQVDWETLGPQFPLPLVGLVPIVERSLACHENLVEFFFGLDCGPRLKNSLDFQDATVDALLSDVAECNGLNLLLRPK